MYRSNSRSNLLPSFKLHDLHTHTRTHTHTCACTHTHTHTHARTYTHTHKPAWLRLCHKRLTPVRRPRLRENVDMRCIVMWGPPSALTSFLCNRIHSPEKEIKPLKAACGNPCGRAIKHTHNPLAPWNPFVNVQMYNCV